MKIVIDIPNTLFVNLEKIQNGSLASGIILKSVKNGTVLPKGHGRLGDLDALYEDVINGIKAGNYEEGYEKYAHINNMDDCVECVKYADTIIEADKKSEGKE